MPNIRSAKKRVKVSATKTAANKARKSNLKTMIKKADAACAANAADKETAVRVAIKRVDQACAKGLMHKNAAARCKVSESEFHFAKRKSVCPMWVYALFVLSSYTLKRQSETDLQGVVYPRHGRFVQLAHAVFQPPFVQCADLL